MALPPLTPEQRQAALDKAAASRRERAEVKNRLKNSGASISDVLHEGQGNDRTALIQALPVFEDLAGKAPADVSADWSLLVNRITALQSALDHAGVDPTSYDPRHPPPGLSAQDRGLLRSAAARLAAADTQQALANVQQEVLDVCHTPLEL